MAAVAGTVVALYLAGRAGFPRGRSFLALCALSLTILVGAKLLYLVERRVAPVEVPGPLARTIAENDLWHGFRIPGGVLLLAPVLPLLCRALRLPTLRFADAVLPALGLAIVFIRLGCFLAGCCFGKVSGTPWAVSFPAGAVVYDWHMSAHLIRWPAQQSLLVEPLQLYFAFAGLVLYVRASLAAAKALRRRVWLKIYLVFFGSTFFLELLGGYRVWLNIVLSGLSSFATVPIAMSRQRGTKRSPSKSPTP
jgi:phosphatidylglycerol:prolipoprotein diacylglycerol transferase